MAAPAKNIRNFSIIAHIDHGKSTLADRILEQTGAVEARDSRPQLLDSMDLERERGITIKAQAVRVQYTAKDGQDYRLQLIDTPGHVDFTYEVSRSLAACEGALLLVDAAQGVEAQTVANTYLAVDAGLELIPALNKIDLPGAEPERVAGEISELIGDDADGVIKISAKTGEGVTELLEAIVNRVEPPSGDTDAPARALIFDSEFDQYRGVVAYVRVVDGRLAKGDAIAAMQAGTEADIDDIGFFGPALTPVDALEAGEVGYVITGIKDVSLLRVGDTLTTRANPAAEPLPGYQDVKPMVFCGLFPVDTDRFNDLRDALEKLSLNDAALTYEPETSHALGFGFRCGFLGLLHMDIVRERLEREYDVDLLATTPTVEYEVTLTDGTVLPVHAPSEMPERDRIEEIREPYIRATILCPKDAVGAVMDLCQDRRGTHVDMTFMSEARVQIRYDLPLAEVVLDFFDHLKSRTKGYASLDYELIGLRPSDLVKLDILLAGDQVDALSQVVHKDKAYGAGRVIAERLQKQIPRQQFEVAIQAAVGSHIIARESVKPIRKDVIAKCYGGDITRKKKLLEKQKEGKKRMKQVGRIEVPQEAFLSVLQIGDDGTTEAEAALTEAAAVLTAASCRYVNHASRLPRPPPGRPRAHARRPRRDPVLRVLGRHARPPVRGGGPDPARRRRRPVADLHDHRARRGAAEQREPLPAVDHVPAGQRRRRPGGPQGPAAGGRHHAGHRPARQGQPRGQGPAQRQAVRRPGRRLRRQGRPHHRRDPGEGDPRAAGTRWSRARRRRSWDRAWPTSGGCSCCWASAAPCWPSPPSTSSAAAPWPGSTGPRSSARPWTA